MVTKAMIIQACTRTQLGREGMIPSDMFTLESKVTFDQMCLDGDIIMLLESELSNHCPNTRFGLKEEEYPMTLEELMKYRNYCKENYNDHTTCLSYKEYLDRIIV